MPMRNRGNASVPRCWIIDDQDVSGRNAVEAGQASHGSAAFVHPRLRLGQDDTLSLNQAMGNASVSFRAVEFEPLGGRDGLNHSKPDVMSIACMAWGRIAQPHDQARWIHDFVPFRSWRR